MPRDVIGSYRILKVLGEGGMGVVYLGQHQIIGRLAAIKLLRPELSANEEMVARFFNEARTTALIRHPGLVDVYDFGWLEDRSAYIVMEYIEGETLSRALLRLGRLPPDFVAVLGRQMAVALAAAHAKEIVHRDLKPDNVFLVRDEDVDAGTRTRILDFGIAKLGDVPGGAGVHTRTGSLIGTPLYMSPEQCRGSGVVDHRTDIYSLGCMLFEALTGKRLFESDGVGEIIAAHLHTPPPRPSALAPGTPSWLSDAILRMLAKRPGDRPQSMEEVATLLGAQRRKSKAGITAPESSDESRFVPTTTFSRSAAEVLTGGRRMPRWRLGRIAAAALVSTAILAGVFVLVQRGDPKPAPVPVVTPPTPAPSASPSASSPSPSPPPSPPTPAPEPVVLEVKPEPLAAPVPEPTVTLSFRSDPAGAEVFLGADRLGTTPLDHPARKGGDVLTFSVRMAGRVPQAVKVRTDHDQTLALKLPILKKGERSRQETLDPFKD